MNPEILCCKFWTQALISFQISISNAGTFKFFKDNCLIPQLKLSMQDIIVHGNQKEIELQKMEINV